MFEIGDLVWYRTFSRDTMPAVITCRQLREHLTITCRCEGANFDSLGYTYQFESRACHLCGEPTAVPGCPLCPDCIEEQQEQKQDARAEAEQRRRPL